MQESEIRNMVREMLFGRPAAVDQIKDDLTRSMEELTMEPENPSKIDQLMTTLKLWKHHVDKFL